MDGLLQLREVSAAYEGLRALEGITLSVAAGEAVAVLGANGAGKSTLLKTISGQLPAAAGEMVFDGTRLNGLAPHQIARLGILSVPEGRKVFPGLTVEENLLTAVAARGGLRPAACGWRLADKPQADLEEIYSWLPWMAERRAQLGWMLSGGEQQMLAIARALMGRPRLLLLDEPSLGLSPAASGAVFDLIARIHRRGVTLLLVEQNAVYALSHAERAVVLERGRIVLAGSSAELREQPLVRKAYLAV
jgi:branched-chain amino acid transport system ATP-binding protein